MQRGASGLGGVYLQHSVRSQTHLPGRAGDGGDHAPAAEEVQEGGLCPAAAEREQEGQPETSLQTRHQVSATLAHLSLYFSIYLSRCTLNNKYFLEVEIRQKPKWGPVN